MGLGFREVAKEITSALNLGEDEGKIDALAGSLQDAAIKSFGHNSELHTKLVSSLNQSSLQQSNRVKEFLDGERGGGTIITGELSPPQKEALERSMSPEQMESLGLARNILKNMMDAGAVQEPRRCQYSAVPVKQPTTCSSRSSCACSLTDVADASGTCSSQVATWPCHLVSW